MSTVFSTLITNNPLLGHGPRTHRTGVVLASESTAPAASSRFWFDSPDTARLHLGRDHHSR